MRNLSLILTSIILFCVTVYSGAFGDPVRLATASALYFLAGFLIKKERTWIQYLILYLPFLSIFTGFLFQQFISDPGQTRFFENLPLVITVPLALYIGYRCNTFVKNAQRKWMLLIMYCMIAPAFLYYGWFNYTSQSHKEKLQMVELPQHLTLRDVEGNIIEQEQWKGKVVILDIWTRTCGICLSQMPHFNDYFNAFKTNEDIRIYSLYLPIKGDEDSVATDLFATLEYDFPIIISDIDFKTLAKEMGFGGVPLFLIIDKNGAIRYSGLFNYSSYNVLNNAYALTRKIVAH